MFKTISFIGSGRIARIMLSGWTKAGTLPHRILAHDTDASTIAALQAICPDVAPATLAEAAGADLVFGALHPPAMNATLTVLQAHLQPNAVFCSLAPVIRLPALQNKLGGFSRLARMNPNAPSIIGAGFNPIAFSASLPAEERSALLRLLQPLGAAPEISDEDIENYAVLSAMGPTYFWFQYEELRQLAESWGLDPLAVKQAMAHMLRGAADTMFASELTPQQVLDLVPVRPMADDEPSIRQMMRARIGAIYTKLHPAG